MQDIKAFLSSYIPALRYALLCFRELDEARDVSVKSPRLDGMPRSGRIGGLEMQISQIEAIRAKAEAAREKVLKILDEIESLIEELEDMDQRTVIKMRYIYGDKWVQIAQAVNLSERSVFYIHDKALAELRKVWVNEKADTPVTVFGNRGT